MDFHSFDDSDLTAEIVDRQLELWNSRRRAVREKENKPPQSAFHFLTIAMDEGSLGNEIAQELSRHLDWHVFDKEIVGYIAKTNSVRENLVRQLDQKSQGIIQDVISSILGTPEQRPFGGAEYYESLIETLLCIAKHGSAILIGRGANFALRHDRRGLNVWITASPEIRAHRLSETRKMPIEEARHRIRTDDEEQGRFILHYYKQEYGDTRFYDMIFNTDRASAGRVAASIIGFMKGPAV